MGLLEFEDHLLDRERPWAGTGGKTLKDLGYGILGPYRRHVKEHINRLLISAITPASANRSNPS